MNRFWIKAVLCGLLFAFAGCSRQRDDKVESAEWNEIQPLADDAVMVQAGEGKPQEQQPEPGLPDDEWKRLSLQLESMQSITRRPGETLLTGKSLVFDYDRRFVRLDENVKVVDDRGVLETDSLIGRFSVSNEVEYVEVQGGVIAHGEGREVRGDSAVYDYRKAYIQLDGKASVVDGANRLSGERIRFWIKGNRKVVCEPNALLVVAGGTGLAINGGLDGSGETEIRAATLIYDEVQRFAEMEKDVRIRDPRASINCEKVKVHFKTDNEIDWIEALGEVIILREDGKALADRATYHADEGKFTLEGDPKVQQGKNIMSGNRITFWHETRRMVCEPNARILLHLDEETKAKFLKDLNK